MAYSTVRDLCNKSLKISGVVGIGMTASAEQMSDAVNSLNLILSGIYGLNKGSALTSVTLSTNGQYNYTIGPIGDTVPDLELPILPQSISGVTLLIGNDRHVLKQIDPLEYFGRGSDSDSTPIPAGFYYERTAPLGTLRFFDGSPTDDIEIIYTPLVVDVTANTSAKFWVPELVPYLVYKLASEIATENAFDNVATQQQANRYWNIYRGSITPKQGMGHDKSAISTFGNDEGFNIYSGRFNV